MADETKPGETPAAPTAQIDQKQLLAALYALFGGMGGGGGPGGLGQNLLQFQNQSPFMQQGLDPQGGLVQRPNFAVGQLPGAQAAAPGGGNVHFTGGSPFEVNPWPTRIGNTLSGIGRIIEQLQTNKVKAAAAAKAKGPTNGG